MLFEKQLRDGIADGTVTVAFRRWKRPQVVAGGVYRTGVGRAEAVRVDRIAKRAITAVDARRAGLRSRADLVAELRRLGDAPIYRVEFRRVDDADPRAELAATNALSTDDVDAITARLDRFDAASTHGPWTRATLAAIEREPGRRAPDLATAFGRETAPFKRDVRKLKELGLTVSLEIGYQLSPRGESYLRAAAKPAASSTSSAARTTSSP